MRVKIGDTWFEATADAAIMIELTPANRGLLANMADGADRFAEFHEADGRSADEKRAWMDAGSASAGAERAS